jgi:hypothetical protein
MQSLSGQVHYTERLNIVFCRNIRGAHVLQAASTDISISDALWRCYGAARRNQDRYSDTSLHHPEAAVAEGVRSIDISRSKLVRSGTQFLKQRIEMRCMHPR